PVPLAPVKSSLKVVVQPAGAVGMDALAASAVAVAMTGATTATPIRSSLVRRFLRSGGMGGPPVGVRERSHVRVGCGAPPSLSLPRRGRHKIRPRRRDYLVTKPNDPLPRCDRGSLNTWTNVTQLLTDFSERRPSGVATSGR